MGCTARKKEPNQISYRIQESWSLQHEGGSAAMAYARGRPLGDNIQRRHTTQFLHTMVVSCGPSTRGAAALLQRTSINLSLVIEMNEKWEIESESRAIGIIRHITEFPSKNIPNISFIDKYINILTIKVCFRYAVQPCPLEDRTLPHIPRRIG